EKQTSGRNDKIGQAHANTQQGQNLEGRVLRLEWFPSFPWNDRQRSQGTHQQEVMYQCLRARLEVTGNQVRVGITREQDQLKKQHASRPYPGASSEPWQNVFADQWLHLEEQERSQEDRQRKNGHARLCEKPG